MDKTLKNKFESAFEADWVSKKAKEDPSFEFPCLVRTWKSVAEWPDDVKPGSNIGGEFYTFRVTFEKLEKIVAMPEVRALTVR